MRFTDEEIMLLDKLASGVLDGGVGDIMTCGGYKTVYVGKYIKDGVPVSYKQGESMRFFDGRENERIPGNREEIYYDTDEKKLMFLQKYGWLMDDKDVKAYSAKFKTK